MRLLIQTETPNALQRTRHERRGCNHGVPWAGSLGRSGVMNTSSIQSPDGKYAVGKQDDYGEIGMGSPAFGHIIFRGADVHFPDYLFGESVVFSPDSRSVALGQLAEVRPFRTKLVAVELPHGTVHFVRLQPQGTDTPQRWESATRLIYRVWSVGSAAESQYWDAPAPVAAPRKKGLFSLWR